MPAVQLEALRFSRAAVGGPKAAELRAEGSREDLNKLLGMLGQQLTIHVDGSAAWWGYIHEVAIVDGRTEVSASLDNLSNRVAVAYEAWVAGTERTVRMTTPWAEDALSIKMFGVKELLAPTRSFFGEWIRDRLLATRRYPQARVELGSGNESKPHAVILCKGLWETLSWRYASVPLSMALQYERIGAQVVSLGASNPMRVAQAIDIGPSPVNAAGIGVYVRRVGTPTDNLVISLHENPDDLTPGTQLASVSSAAGTVPTAYDWFKVQFAPVALTARTSYFIQIARSGAADAANYYEVKMDGLEGYPAGPARVYDGSNWGAVAADLPFRLYSNTIVENSQQILNLLTAFGQFLAYPRVDTRSDEGMESYRDGDSTAQAEIEDLLKMGSGGNRYLAEVAEGGMVRVYLEPVESAEMYVIDRDMRVYSPEGAPVEPWRVPAGVWMRMKENLSAVHNQVAGVQMSMFAEEIDFDLRSGALRITPAGTRNLYQEIAEAAIG